MRVEDRFAGALTEKARSCSDSSALRQWTLAQIAGLLPFDSAIFLSPRLAEAPSMVNKAEFRHLYWNYARNPERYRRGLAKGARAAGALGGAYLDTDVFSASERRNLPLYVEMVRPQGIASQIVARPTFHGRSIGLVYLCRHGTGRFRGRDLECMLRLLSIIALSHAAVDSVATAPGSPRAASAEVEPRRDVIDSLSARERDVVLYASVGMSSREIAELLGTSLNTVNKQVASAYRKLGVSRRAELAWLLHRGDPGGAR